MNITGYASASCDKVCDWAEIVLAELTQLLMPRMPAISALDDAVERRLVLPRVLGAFDAGFGRLYVYERFQRADEPWQSAFAARAVG